MTKRGEPPTSQARVAMFMSSVADYDAMQEALPLPTGFIIGGPPRDPAEQWITTMHAMILRKYFHGEDHLNLVTVVGSIRDCVIDAREGQEDILVALADRAGGVATSSRVSHVVGDQPARGEAAITIDDLYGRYMHGDYDRWQRSEVAAGTPSGMASLIWTTDARKILLLTASAVALGLKDGSIAY